MKTKSNEWYTPVRYVEAARAVLGGIDLDPASCEFANKTVRATAYYDEATNGLEQSWHGRVWLNPPYSNVLIMRGMESGNRSPSIIGAWIDKLVAEYRAGNVSEAILLAKADPKQKWF